MLLAATAIAVFGIVAACWYVVDFNFAASANRTAASQKQELFATLMELQGRELTSAVEGEAKATDLTELLRTNPEAKQLPANEQLVGPVSLYLFDKSWSLKAQDKKGALSSEELEALRQAAPKPALREHFFTFRSNALTEFRTKAVRDSRGNIAGYLVGTSRWQQQRLDDLSSITESSASLVAPNEPLTPITDQGYTVALPLSGPDGNETAEIRFLVKTDALISAMNRSRLAGIFLLMLMIGLTGALMATVARNLIAPLGKLAHGLDHQNTDFSNTFKASAREISQLADAISESFAQKSELDSLNKTLASTIESLNEANGQLSSYNEALEQRVQERTRDIGQAIETTIYGWSKAMDSRDHETEGHTRRVAEMSHALGVKAGLEGDELQNLKFGALLHDIGKIGIPDSILLKPGKLTEGEFEVMRNHTLLGFEMLKDIPFLQDAVEVVLYHHERWDGTGYPYGLKGEEIPFAARLFAIADVWDALRSDRPYREAWSEERVREYIKEQSGIHFDPRIVDIYLGLEPLKHPSDRKTERKAA